MRGRVLLKGDEGRRGCLSRQPTVSVDMTGALKPRQSSRETR